MSVRGFRDGLAEIVPVWLSNRPGLNTGYKVLYTICLFLDIFTESVNQGVQAPWPGFGTPTADPYIAANRQLVQGETETDGAFEARLRAWLDIWAAGSTIWPNRAALAQRLHEYIGNHPRVRIVSRAGNWVTVDAAGIITYNQGVVPNFDNLNTPTRSGWWSDMWIIIDPPEWVIETRTLAQIATAYGTFQAWGQPQLGIGHRVGRAVVDGIQGLISQWKGAHTNIRFIIWNYSGDYDPNNYPASFPEDGYWGPWATMTNGTNVTVHRSAADRYWDCRSSLPTQ